MIKTKETTIGRLWIAQLPLTISMFFEDSLEEILGNHLLLFLLRNF